jgi:predicted RNA-binding Zn-ribbon protein involved in translation (DUF1610 family)
VKKKKPRFFCDGCGAEVGAKDERCPRCGKFFASIRCPACGFSGDQDIFDKGCPVCGYSAQNAKSSPAAQVSQNAAVPSRLYIICIALLVLAFALLVAYITR